MDKYVFGWIFASRFPRHQESINAKDATERGP